ESRVDGAARGEVHDSRRAALGRRRGRPRARRRADARVDRRHGRRLPRHHSRPASSTRSRARVTEDINPNAAVHAEYRRGVRELCARFDSKYWQAVDAEPRYPEEFVDALTDA